MWYTILITLVVDVGGLLLVYVLLRDRVRRATSAEAQISEIRDEVSRLVVELNQTTDRNIALVEDRISSLNEQLSVADKKIGLLRREIEKHDVGTQVYSRLAETRPRPSPPVPPLSVELSEKPVPPEDERAAGLREWREPAPERAPAASARGIAGRQETVVGAQGEARPEAPASAQRAAAPGRREEAGDLRDRVMLLFRSGFAAPLIASRVGVPLGEVELIISLEQRKGQG
jgi:hypothetical protein